MTERRDAIRVMVVEDHTMFAEALTSMLTSQSDLAVVGHARSGGEAVKRAAELAPDVVLMDYRLPDGEGTVAARAIRDTNPEVRVLIVTASAEESLLREVVRSGCSGIVGKGRSIHDLVRAVRSAAAGETVIAPTLIEQMISPRRGDGMGSGLTERELETLRLVSEGLTTAQVAEGMGISPHTVRNHLQGAIRKLGVHSKTQAISAAIRRGIIPSPG